MKKYALIFLLLIFPASVFADAAVVEEVVSGAAAGNGNGVSYIFSEDFDGSTDCYSGDETYENCDNTWTLIGPPDTNDFKSTIAGADGTYCYNFAETTTGHSGVSILLGSGYDSINLYMMFQKDTDGGNDPGGTTAYFFSARDSGDSDSPFYCSWDTNDDIVCFHGAVSDTLINSASEDTWYHMWIEWTKGSGSNGTLVVTLETSATKGSADINISNGDGNYTFQLMKMRDSGSDSSNGIYVDKIRLDDVEIGSDPT